MLRPRTRTILAACAAAVAFASAVWVLRPSVIPAQDVRALEFVDRNGLPLGTILSRDGAHTAFVPLARIAPAFVRAALATEDVRFFSHGPLDVRSALRIGLGALAHGGSLTGASTVSMQLARLLHPVAPGPLGRIREVVLAARLENGTSKEHILEAYCNRVPMGGNVYGVEAASLAYFGIHAWELDVAQAALLAGIPNDPTRLEPYRHWRAAKARQRVVLGRMVAAGLLARDDARRAAREMLLLRPASAGIVAAPHFLFWLARSVPATATVVRTSIDRPLQLFVEAQLRAVVRTLAAHAVHSAAALVVDNRTGAVLAYAGSPDYFSDVALGRNDGVQALRQPGSALKPFLYELALERRTLRPNSVLLDAPVTYAIPGGKLYQPSDYDRRFLGPVRVRVALANSLNVPAVRVLERVGVAAFLERLRGLGFVHLRDSPDYYGLGLTLGGGEVSLFELTRAFTTLARQGEKAELTGFSVEPARTVAVPPARDAAWSVVTDMLSDRHARAAAFGVDSVLALPFPSAVKTGTSSDFRDTWTVGFTRDVTVGIWVGNFDGAPMRAISGVTGAAPLWNRILLHIHERTEPGGFPAPEGYVRVPICAATGLRPTRACMTIVDEWLDSADRVAYRKTNPVLAPAPVAIAFPHDGDRFALLSGAGPQRIDVAVAASSPSSVSVTVDGRALERTAGAYTWNLRLGLHDIAARQGAHVAHVRIVVERPPASSRQGFTVVDR